MTQIAEQSRRGEILSPAELGERNHVAITDIATKLQGIPEFGDALHKAFWGRHSPEAGRNILDNVFFIKGNYGYSISFQAEPRRFHPSQIQDYNPHMSLIITKHQAEHPRIAVGEVYLTTAFTEDQDGKISKFRDGHAEVIEGKNKYKGSSALEKIPEVLADLFVPIKL